MITALLFVLTQTAAATPTPAPAPAALSGGFGQKAATPKKAKVVITDGALASTGHGGTLTVAGPRAIVPVGTPAPAAADEETSWRARVAGLRADLAKAQKEYDALDRANTVVSYGTHRGQAYYTLMAIRDSALAPTRIRLAEIKDSLAALPEECRKTTGCQPGWIR